MTDVSVSIRLGNNRAIMTSKNTNISDLLDALEYQPSSNIKSMYRLRFRLLEAEITDIIESLQGTALNLTVTIGKKKMALNGYFIYNHSYAVLTGKRPYYDVWVSPNRV